MATGFSMLVGVALAGIGLWGMASGGHDHDLIIFGVNATHNLVHLLSGALGIGAALGGRGPAKMYCLALGAIYGLVALAGFVNVSEVVGLLNLNTADNLLHAGIAVACLVVGSQARG